MPHVAFVGGSTTALLITDPVTLEAVRYTQDIDLIVDADSRAGWYQLQQQLRARGFKESMDDEIVCRMNLGGLKVDFMPLDECILGFTNRWYRAALASARRYALTRNLTIRVLAPEYFLATKLEA